MPAPAYARHVRIGKIQSISATPMPARTVTVALPAMPGVTAATLYGFYDAFAGVVRELGDDSVLFDFNHPLAGQAVGFEVHLIGVL